MSTGFQDDYLSYLYRLRDRIDDLIKDRVTEIMYMNREQVKDSRVEKLSSLRDDLIYPDWQ